MMGCEDAFLLLGGLEDHFGRTPGPHAPPGMPFWRNQPSQGSDGSTAIRENKARVFIVEDEEYIRELYKDVFEAAGMTVFSASNGDEAITIFKTLPSKPDIVVMDHRMPGKDGIQTTKELLEIDPSVPIIFSSADISVRERALEAGAVSFWEKPFPCSLLVNAMIDIVRARKM